LPHRPPIGLEILPERLRQSVGESDT
jgi:hypothetical protein